MCICAHSRVRDREGNPLMLPMLEKTNQHSRPPTATAEQIFPRHSVFTSVCLNKAIIHVCYDTHMFYMAWMSIWMLVASRITNIHGPHKESPPVTLIPLCYIYSMLPAMGFFLGLQCTIKSQLCSWEASEYIVFWIAFEKACNHNFETVMKIQCFFSNTHWLLTSSSASL